MLKIENLEVSVDGKKILKGINFSAGRGEIHAIMGPNGSGKSSLAFTIMGNPKYKVEKGAIFFDGKDITHLKPDERAKAGIFLAFQYPYEIPGVPLGKFLWTIAGGGRNFSDFSKEFKQKMSLLKIPDEFSKREINKGFSGGEKKRTEILQMLMLKPTLAILDEIDSGLDVDSLKIVSQAVLEFTQSKDKIVIIITHYPRILNYIKPDIVHVIFDGKIVLSGDHSLATEIEERGYEKILKDIGFHIEKKEITAKDVL